MADPRTHVWSLMVQAGIDGQVSHEALQDLIIHTKQETARRQRAAEAAWKLAGYPGTRPKGWHTDLIDPDVETDYDTPKDRGGCGCYPHGPEQPCTCNGCTSCVGHVIGCTCDIDWDCAHERS